MSASPTVPTVEERAAALVRRAKTAALAGYLEEAVAALRDAWELAPSPPTACNIGRLEFMRQRMRDAAEFLSICLEAGPPLRTQTEHNRFTRTFKELTEARARLVTLTIRVNPPNAFLLVDKRPVGIARHRPVFIDAGPHRITAILKGYEPATAEIVGGNGDSRNITLTLSPAPHASPSDDGKTRPHDEGNSRPNP